MTKPRDPATFEDAAVEAIHHLTAETCARLIDRTAGAVRKYADPESDGRPLVHHCLLIDAEMFRTTGRAPFRRAYDEQLRLLTRDSSQVPGDMVMEALDVSTAVGALTELVRKARDAASPGGQALSGAEEKALLAKIKEVRRQLDECEDAVRGGQAKRR